MGIVSSQQRPFCVGFCGAVKSTLWQAQIGRETRELLRNAGKCRLIGALPGIKFMDNALKADHGKQTGTEASQPGKS